MPDDRENVIKKVQALWRLAEHPNTGNAERENAIRRANEMMAKYAIDEISMQEASGKREEIVLANIRITEDGKSTIVKDQRIALAYVIARNNRCRGVIRTMEPTADMESGKLIPGGTFLTVMGYVSDTRFVREFYNGLVMDMLGALMDEKVQTENYRVSFCAGFVTRVDERLVSMGKVVEAEAGSLLPAIRERGAEVDDRFENMFPNLKKAKVSRRSYDPNAVARGRKAADAADVGQEKIAGTREALDKAKKQLNS